MIIHFASETAELSDRPRGPSSGFSWANLEQISLFQPTSLFVFNTKHQNSPNICLALGPEVEPKTGSKLSLAAVLFFWLLFLRSLWSDGREELQK